MTHEHHGLELFRGLQSNADHYQYAGRAKHRIEAEGAHGQRGDYSYQHKEERTEQSQAVAYLGQIFACGLAGTDAGDKAAVLLKVLAISMGLKEIEL